MTRLPVFALSLFLVSPAVAQEGAELVERARQTAAEAITESMTDPSNPGQAGVSRLFEKDGQPTLCSVTDAHTPGGTYIGRTYWEVSLNDDGSEVVSTRNVTGLFSDCYGEDYQAFSEILEE
ncbi:hypothetical protein [Tropicibacter sp. Alg240-R139]|uniref:hypothetical protein n=1 Tax=Tropicibacter sp. Alg240-R139 TaxID=2305991 RepID=UPI0013DEE77B|nr:hypothetical protein [Tropicibacter sp. Alg240-R139]